MSSSTRVRKTYSTAAMATLDGALKLPAAGAVPVKSIAARRLVDGDGDPDHRAVVHLEAKAPSSRR